jgi:hypothetical protein
MDTLLVRRAIRARKTVNYITLRSWYQPIRNYQIEVFRALKQYVLPPLQKAITAELVTEANCLIDIAAFKAIVSIPGSHSIGGHCPSQKTAGLIATQLKLPVVLSLPLQSMKSLSHPRESAEKPPFILQRILRKPILLVYDVSTSSSYSLNRSSQYRLRSGIDLVLGATFPCNKLLRFARVQQSSGRYATLYGRAAEKPPIVRQTRTPAKARAAHR